MALHIRRAQVYLKTFLLFSVVLELANADYRVDLVQVIFRHGDRTPRPEELYPKLPYDPSIYNSTGFGQLTDVGKRREYRLGTLLRELYDDLLGNVSHPGDVYAVSTDFDRTKMSLQLVLTGLRPKRSITSDQIAKWLPIPMNCFPKLVDTILMSQFCPTYQEELNEVRYSNTIRRRILKYNDLFELITEKTGINMTSNPILLTSNLYQLLTSQISMNISTPEWITDDIYKRIEEVMALEYEIRSYTRQLKRLYGGALIKQFIKNMNLEGGRKSTSKMYLYSAHEINVAGFARAHDFTEPRVPHYGSAVILEKLRNGAGKEFVKMMLWTGVTEKLTTYNFPESGSNGIYPIEQYLKLVKHVIPTDRESDCLWDNITKEELREYYDVRKIWPNKRSEAEKRLQS